MNTFSDFYFRSYSTKTWSFEHFFCLFTYFLIFALPFYFAFGGSNFWFQQRTTQLKVEYQNVGYYALEVSYLESNVNQVQTFCNVPGIGESMVTLSGSSLQIEEDSESLRATLTLQGFESKSINSVSFMMFYDVVIPDLAKVYSSAISFSLRGDVGSAAVSGKMKLSVGEPLNALTEIQAGSVNFPVYYTMDLQPPTSYSELVDSYLSSNIKITSDVHTSKLESSSSGSRTLSVSLVKEREIVLPYYPSILETFKLKFSTYFGFLILTYLILRNIMVMAIQEEGLECHQADQMPPTRKL